MSWKVKKMLKDQSVEKPEARKASTSRYKPEFDDGRQSSIDAITARTPASDKYYY